MGKYQLDYKGQASVQKFHEKKFYGRWKRYQYKKNATQARIDALRKKSRGKEKK